VSFQFLPGLSGPLPDETVVVRHEGDEYVLDVLALMSNYQCIYGAGCQGTTPLLPEGPGMHRPDDPSVTGCCRTAPRYREPTARARESGLAEGDSPSRIAPFVAALTPDEAQHYARIASGDWFSESQDEDGRWTVANTTEGGNCIFLNTEMANGKTGCSLYHTALRLGVDPKLARPIGAIPSLPPHS
jgi:hypothetical protein